jgi:hypothetical protein
MDTYSIFEKIEPSPLKLRFTYEKLSEVAKELMLSNIDLKEIL